MVLLHQNSMSMFIALLAPDTWGGVRIPKRFDEAYQYAIRIGLGSTGNCTIDEALVGVDNKEFSSTVRSLHELIVPQMQGFALDYVSTAMLRLHGPDSLALSMTQDARKADEVFRAAYGDTYCRMREVFPQAFASRFPRPRRVFDDLCRTQEYRLDETLL